MNQAVNFFWTIFCFIPVIAFWAATDTMLWCYLFLGISAISLFIPARLLQLSKQPRFYEQLGVKIIRKVVQNGDWVNRFTRKAKPANRLISNKASAVKYMQTVMMYERYHFLSLVFFMLTAGYALTLGNYAMAAVILVANLIYNVCPILLQQYNRARLIRLQK